MPPLYYQPPARADVNQRNDFSPILYQPIFLVYIELLPVFLSFLGIRMEKLYSAQDIRRLFGFAPGRIRYWDKIGFLTPSVKIGTRRYYTSQDLIGLRTVRGLLDAGLPFARVRRSVIDIKKISPRAVEPLSQLLIHGDGKEWVFDPGTVRFNPRRQSLIGFSQGDFERGMKSANRQIEPYLKPEPEEKGVARENPRGIEGSITSKNP